MRMGEERQKRGKGRSGILLGHEVAAVDAPAIKRVAPRAPGLQRGLRLAGNAGISPKGQDGAGDLLSRGAVGFVRGKIIGGAGAIVVVTGWTE